MPAIHFGISGAAPGAGRLRHWRAAIRRKRTPARIFPQEIVSDAELLVEASLASETR